MRKLQLDSPPPLDASTDGKYKMAEFEPDDYSNMMSEADAAAFYGS